MAAPTPWSTPTSGGTIASFPATGYDSTSYANGYFFALNSAGTISDAYVRWAPETDLSSWSTATLSMGSAQFGVVPKSGVEYHGGTYAFSIRRSTITGGTHVDSQVYYTDDPAGTWTAVTWGTAIVLHGLVYRDSTWIAYGGKYIAGTVAEVMFTASDPSLAQGSWTEITGQPGNTVSSYQLNTNQGIRGLEYDGTTWVMSHGPVATTPLLMASYSTALTGPWTQISNGGLRFDQAGYVTYADPYWVLYGRTGGFGSGKAIYSTDPSSGFASIPAGTVSTSDQLDLIYAVQYDGEYFGLAGANYLTVANLYYATAITDVPWTAATASGLTSSNYPASMTYRNGLWVANTIGGRLFYTGTLIPPPTPTTFTLLRQRQSPLRTPARVRGVDLRQRQTPFVT